MPFRFERANCVAVGTFNIYIVQPAWLAARGIIPQNIQVAIGSNLDEPCFRFHSPKLRSQWVVTPGRIEVQTRTANEDCGALVSKVLEKLPWTPLKAVGINATYRAPLEDLESLAALTGFQPAAPDGYSVEQKALHLVLKQGEHLFSLQLSALKEYIELDVNVHTEITEHGSDLGSRSAGKFFEHRKQLETLISDIFKVSVEYDPPEPLHETDANGVANGRS